MAVSRFRDKDELRFSLRSLWKFAPWVRHVYVVTNGQVPGWLALDRPRLSVVTHEEIYPNRSHLPTLSSPSIETHLHRIAGLSEHFLYFNDDMLLADRVVPSDFVTPSRAVKVYLSFSVPRCAYGCPNDKLGDGRCHRLCHTCDRSVAGTAATTSARLASSDRAASCTALGTARQ